MAPYALSIAVEDGGGFMQTLAEFVEGQPLIAAIVAAIILVLVLLLLRKIFSIALVVIAIAAVLLGALVYMVGPGQARDYLEALGAKAGEVIEGLKK